MPDRMERLLYSADRSAEDARDRLLDFTMEPFGDPQGISVLDETGFLKKGTASVGVARQYSGTAGKIENCRRGVFVSYTRACGHVLLDPRLYLPASWCSDPARRQRAHVPEEVVFQTKPQLAMQMLQQAWQRGVPMAWMTGDEVYGDDPALRDGIAAARHRYVLAVACTMPVWPERPAIVEPSIDQAHRRGPRRTRTRLAPDAPHASTVAKVVAQRSPTPWHRLAVHQGEKGPMAYDWACVHVIDSRQQLPTDEVWLLARRSVSKPSEVAYYLSNAEADTPQSTLAHVASTRYTIEQCFEEARDDVGLDQLAGCTAAFNAIHDEIAWLLDHTRPASRTTRSILTRRSWSKTEWPTLSQRSIVSRPYFPASCGMALARRRRMDMRESRLAGLVVVVAGVVGVGGCGGEFFPSSSHPPPSDRVNDDNPSSDPSRSSNPLVDELPAAPMPRVVSAGVFHAAALDETGHALCWGRELGWNVSAPFGLTSRPMPCGNTETEYTSISAGDAHTCAVTAAGDVHCWGQGFRPSDLVPPKLQSRATAIAVAEDRTCAILEGGSVVCWGWDASLPSLLAPATHIAGSGRLTCARLSSGAVSCWGDDLGHGAVGGSLKVQAARSIAVGYNHACAIVASNTNAEANEVACWGGNYYGQLGDGTIDDRHEPVRIGAGILVDPIAVSAGVNTTCALTAAGSVYCWGWNIDGQLGNGKVGAIQQKEPGGLAPTTEDRLLPTPVSGLPHGAIAITMGGYTAFATLSSGAIVAWGHSNSGQIGDGSKIDRPTPVGIALH